MKKLLFAVMMAVLAIPVMHAQTDATKAAAMRPMDRNVIMKSSIPMKANEWGVRKTANMMRGTVLYSWDWETDESFEGWGSYDYDGDGYGWSYDESSYYIEAYSGTTFLVSDSYISGTALDPDNWLISPDITLDGTLSIMAMNYGSYFADHFMVYVCVGEMTSLDDFVAISELCTPATSWTEYTFDLTPYQGQVGCFAIRHCESYNKYHLYIDDITIVKEEVAEVPENLTVENVYPHTADATWDDNTNAAWNLRYRELVEGVENNLLWDFEEDTDGNSNIELTGGWTSIDADGDGYDWYHLYGVANLKTHSGTGHVTSASYNGDALNPDNWLISPEVKLDGELSFWACGQDPSYAAEVFCVYASTDKQNWEPLTDDITATGEMTQYTFDLTDYQGVQGYVAIRHYNTYDKFRLNIDDIAITYVQEPEWIYAENLDATEYTMEGLTPETTYEVQVMGITANGTESAWTESTIFTTPAEVVGPEQAEKPVITGEDGTNGVHAHFVTIEADEFATIMYRYQKDNGEWSEWMVYEGELAFTLDGDYVLEAYANVPEMTDSEVATYEFTITPRTAVNELNGEKAVAGVRYFNAMGQEMAQPEGMTIVVTTYSDGSTSAVKVMK